MKISWKIGFIRFTMMICALALAIGWFKLWFWLSNGGLWGLFCFISPLFILMIIVLGVVDESK